MTTLYNLIQDAIENGINKKLLLMATGLNEEIFTLKLHENQFNFEEVKQIKLTIREWEAGR